MASCFIVKRARKHVVRYRLGGRAYPVQHGGSFDTLKLAKVRRDLIAGELAAGRNPADLLRSFAATPVAAVTVAEWRDRFLASRINLDTNTIRGYRTSLKKACERFGTSDPAAITWQEVAEWVAGLAEKHKPGTVRLYRTHFAVLLDYIGVDPNPAKHKQVKVPKQVTEEVNPPTGEHFLAILDAIDPEKHHSRRVLFLVIEQGALRLGEAVGLRWGDVDRAGLRLRLPRSATKRDRARWVYLPEWLVDALEDLCPLEDRTPERKVFQGVTEATAYQTMKRACEMAGVPHYHPHDLRHRRITVWHQSGVVARELAERAGHTRASITLDVYSHVMPLQEAPEETLAALVRATS